VKIKSRPNALHSDILQVCYIYTNLFKEHFLKKTNVQLKKETNVHSTAELQK